MLVLSRRPQEKILFPGLEAVVQVVSIRPGIVRLGIEAPPHVTVLREEVHRRQLAGDPPATQPRPAARPHIPDEKQLADLNHSVRNHLNTMSLGLSLLRRQLQAARQHDVEATLRGIEQALNALRGQVEGLVPAVPSSPPSRPRRPRKALLVEDDQNERELLAGLLRIAGLDVDTAGDGADALNYLQGHSRPDVVLLDMVLPRCDGPTTVREIRRNPANADLKIFAVSGHAPERFRLDQGPARVDRWFRKPINPEALLHDLSEVLSTN
jgi:carbon storage regulator CsrA